MRIGFSFDFIIYFLSRDATVIDERAQGLVVVVAMMTFISFALQQLRSHRPFGIISYARGGLCLCLCERTHCVFCITYIVCFVLFFAITYQSTVDQSKRFKNRGKRSKSLLKHNNHLYLIRLIAQRSGGGSSRSACRHRATS
jgi:hypothetical protein